MTKVSIVPETMSPTMKMGLDVASITVRARATIALAAENQDAAPQKVALVVVIDESGSTTDQGNAMPNGQLIFNVERDAVKETIFQMGDADLVGVVSFDSSARKRLDLTGCDAGGRDRAVMTADRMQASNGMTNYADALQQAAAMLRGVTGANRAIAFLTDGQCNEGGDPLPVAEQIRKDGIVICTAAVSKNLSAEDEARLKAMSGGANFKACETAEEVARFLAGALRKAKNTALSNVTLRFQPIGLVTEVKVFDMVTRSGKRNYVAGKVTPKSDTKPASGEVALGELGPNEEIEVYLEFSFKPPKFADSANFQKRTFGELMVVAACPSEGVTTPAEFGKTEMFQNFARQTSGASNPEVEKLKAEWIAASAIDAASRTGNAAEQQRILGEAAVKVKRATQVFADDEGLAGSLTDLETLKTTAATQGGGATQKLANRQTAVFADED